MSTTDPTKTGEEKRFRQALREHYLDDEPHAVRHLISQSRITADDRARIVNRAIVLIESVRQGSDPQIMESFLGEYGLSTEEGISLMCLAEALLRVPDAATVDSLIQDKIVPADWGKHLGKSSSSLVNASTWALLLTGKIIADEPRGVVGTLQGAIRRLGEPVVRKAVSQAIRELGNQFVLGETVDAAIKKSRAEVTRGYTYSYDMLGEAARTEADARRYHLAYSDAISTLSSTCTGESVATNPGISVKLSALYPRYEYAQKQKVMIELVARARSLALLAKSANMGFNIDAEESDRLELSLDVIESILADPSLAGWDGFGVVIQAYSPRAWYVIDCLYDLAQRLDRNIMIRLVKGAYWDTEIKRAQVLGLDGFPVFTRKSNTDISYIVCAEKLLGMTDKIYPQFATHNAHTVAAILQLAKDKKAFEFQRLHGMGEALHSQVLNEAGTRCRIYAPVGAHEDLLAYLVRRLLENGANSSFVNQIVDESVSATDIAVDPFASVDDYPSISNPLIVKPSEMFGDERINSRGLDLTDPAAVENLYSLINNFSTNQWKAFPLVPTVESQAYETAVTLYNPANKIDIVGEVKLATTALIQTAVTNAIEVQNTWQETSPDVRAQILQRTSDLFEQNSAELISLATREAGKTIADGVAEIREAVDFLRYYPVRAAELLLTNKVNARGIFVCISPWNFPLAIFTGQIAAALATGNTVIAKPAEQTPLIAMRAIELFHQAGVPPSVLQFMPGTGSIIGAQLVSDPRVAGVCFTGSTATAQRINKAMAEQGNAGAPLIAETGGLNAMIVDSTSLPEQSIRDILASAFQSAGQRCSALRVLYVQKDIESRLLNMLKGAMDLLVIGNPGILSTDIGPVIDIQAATTIKNHCQQLEGRGRLIHKTKLPAELDDGCFVAPSVYRLNSISELKLEIFGPILHVISFAAHEFPSIIQDINNSGYGLTFGLHTRVDERVQDVVDGIDAGNLYINRNQIGAVVGSQPFGGKGLSGTGPKAGGPHYLLRFLRYNSPASPVSPYNGKSITETELQQAVKQLNTARLYTPASLAQVRNLFNRITLPTSLDPAVIHTALDFVDLSYHDTKDLPGPTGESNRLSMHPAGLILCLQASDPTFWIAQILQCLAIGNQVIAVGEDTDSLHPFVAHDAKLPIIVIKGQLADNALSHIDINGIATAIEHPQLHNLRLELANRTGPILPVSSDLFDISPLVNEKSLCVDTTAAGGNASLLALAD